MSELSRPLRAGNFAMLAILVFTLIGCGQVVERLSTSLDTGRGKSVGLKPAASSKDPVHENPVAVRVEPPAQSTQLLPESTKATPVSIEKVRELPTRGVKDESQRRSLKNQDSSGFYVSPEEKMVRVGGSNFIFDMTGDFPEVRLIDQADE